jgi:hypothetical protein
MPGTPIMWSPGPLLDRRGLTFQSKEYGGIEYGGLPVEYAISRYHVALQSNSTWPICR